MEGSGGATWVTADPKYYDLTHYSCVRAPWPSWYHYDLQMDAAQAW